MTMVDQPTGYRVDAMRQGGVFSAPNKERTVIQELFHNAEAAHHRKRELQAAGWIANVTPLYVKRGKSFTRTVQSAPFGDFRRTWKLHQFA